MSEVPQWIGRGIYSLREAARLLQVDPEKLARWAMGRTTARRHDAPALIGTVSELAERPTLSFADLIELLFIKGFRARDLSLQYIRRAAEAAAHELSTDHPFSLRRFQTDGQRIFSTELTPAENARTHELITGQLVIDRIVQRYMTQLEYDLESGLAQRWWPLGRAGRVFLDPRTNFGAPQTASGIPTETLFLAYQGNKHSAKAVADWYGIDARDVRAAVKYEQGLAAKLAA